MTLLAARAQLNGATLACLCALAACGTSGSTDAGADVVEECSGPPPACCMNCLGDVLAKTVCTGGTWTCLGVTPAQCANQCTSTPFCSYLPKPVCVSCSDGGHTSKVCNADAALMECPPGTYEMTGDAGSCLQDAAAE